MFLFNRTAAVKAGVPMEGTAFAIEAAEKAANAIGAPVAVYSTRLGGPLNQLLWSLRVESHAQLDEINVKLMADETYLALLPRGAELFDGAPTDNISQVVSSTLTPAPKRFYGVTQAVIANGKIRQAMDFGVRVQDYVAGETGLATAFVSSTYGSYGGVGWLVGGDSMADIDTFHAMQSNDHKFHDLVEEAATLFIEGSGENRLIEKIN